MFMCVCMDVCHRYVYVGKLNVFAILASKEMRDEKKKGAGWGEGQGKIGETKRIKTTFYIRTKEKNGIKKK